jgi:hypothetical protein
MMCCCCEILRWQEITVSNNIATSAAVGYSYTVTATLLQYRYRRRETFSATTARPDRGCSVANWGTTDGTHALVHSTSARVHLQHVCIYHMYVQRTRVPRHGVNPLASLRQSRTPSNNQKSWAAPLTARRAHGPFARVRLCQLLFAFFLSRLNLVRAIQSRASWYCASASPEWHSADRKAPAPWLASGGAPAGEQHGHQGGKA